jgi:hypothetical protein
MQARLEVAVSCHPPEVGHGPPGSRFCPAPRGRVRTVAHSAPGTPRAGSLIAGLHGRWAVLYPPGLRRAPRCRPSASTGRGPSNPARTPRRLTGPAPAATWDTGHSTPAPQPSHPARNPAGVSTWPGWAAGGGTRTAHGTGRGRRWHASRSALAWLGRHGLAVALRGAEPSHASVSRPAQRGRTSTSHAAAGQAPWLTCRGMGGKSRHIICSCTGFTHLTHGTRTCGCCRETDAGRLRHLEAGGRLQSAALTSPHFAGQPGAYATARAAGL